MNAFVRSNPQRGDINLRSPVQMLEYVAIAERIAHGRPVRVLDWGCGWGQVTDLLVRAGLDVRSFDYRGPGSPNKLVPLKRFPGLEAYVSAESIALPYGDDEFDVVLSCGVLEHVMDPDGSLEEIKRVLRPGGTLYCHKLPNSRSYLEWIARRAGLYHHGMDPFDRLYTKRSAHEMFARHGYEIREERYANMLPLCVSARWARRGARTIWRASRALARVPAVNALSTNVELIAVTPA